MPNVTKQSAFGCVVFIFTSLFLLLFGLVSFCCLKCLRKRENNKKNNLYYLRVQRKKIVASHRNQRNGISSSSRYICKYIYTTKSCLHTTTYPLTLATQCVCLCSVYNELTVKKQNCLLIYRSRNSQQQHTIVTFFLLHLECFLFVCDDK